MEKKGEWVGGEQEKAACGGTHQRRGVGREERRRWAEVEQDEKIKAVEVEDKMAEKVMERLRFEEREEGKEWTEKLQAEGGGGEDGGKVQTAKRRVGGRLRGER